MPAKRRRKKPKNISRSKFNLRRAITLLTLFLFLVLGLYTFDNFTDKKWNGEEKLSMVIRDSSGGVTISTFDPVSEQVNNIYIPGNTQIETARQLGIWKIGSVWDLSQNEKLGGKLLSESVMHQFNLPVGIWSDEQALGLAKGGVKGLVKSALFPYESNLTRIDKIQLAIFSFGVKNKNRINLDLSDTQTLEYKRLKDGSEGFVIANEIIERNKIIFADRQISSEINTLSIINNSGDILAAEGVGKMAEVLGAKVASIKNNEKEQYDCYVWGKNEYITNKFASLLNCERSDNPSSSYDIVIELGEKFLDRY